MGGDDVKASGDSYEMNKQISAGKWNTR